MKIGAVGLAVALTLASCTTTQETQVASALTKACTALTTGYAAYSTVRDAGLVDDSTVKKVEAAYSGVYVLCTGAQSGDPVVLLPKVVAATAVIVVAIKEAKK